MTTKLYPFQRKGVERIDHFEGRTLLADEMGLGKTIQSLAWMVKHQTYPAVVVCPAYLKLNWQREAKTHFGIKAEVVNGTKSRLQQWKRRRPKLIIVNYDVLKQHRKAIERLEPELLIIDETHFIKNLGAQRTKETVLLGQQLDCIIALGGTPTTKGQPVEFWPVLSLLRPDVFDDFYEYAFAYCKPTKSPWGWKYDGASNLKELNKLLRQTCMIRRRKKDVLKQLPSKRRSTVPLELPRPAMKEYLHAETDFLSWLAQQSRAKAHKAKHAQHLVKIGYLRRLAAQLKLPLVMEWIDQFLHDSDGKLTVYGLHKNFLHPLYEHYKQISVLVDGSVTGQHRQNAVDQFQDSKRTRLFFGNIQAAGTGLNLTASSTGLIGELPWSPADLVQVEDRLHRIGQTESVLWYYLIAQDTIELPLCELLHKRMKNLSLVMDGSRPNQDNLDIFEALTKRLKGKQQ